MMKNTLENMVEGIRTTAQVTMTTAVITTSAIATIGAFGAGIYEGCSGQKIFGEGNSIQIVAPAMGYTALILAGLTPQKNKSTPTLIQQIGLIDEEGFVDARMIVFFPPMVGVGLYGIGYGIGKLFQ